MSSSRTSLQLIILGVALCLGATTLAPSVQAQACDEPVVVHSSYPADGATGVPTNTPVFVWGPDLTVAGSDVTLEAGSGQAVQVEVLLAEGGGGLLVDPFLGLAASTRYDLTVAPRAGGTAWSASFTTGTGPATPVQLDAPDVSVTVIEKNQGSCYATAICVSAEVPARMALEVVVGEEVMNVGGGTAPAFLPSESVGSNGCVDVRVREPGGLLSPRTRVCGSALERVVLQDPDSPTPRSCSNIGTGSDGDGGSEDAGGCALGTSGTASGAGGLVLGLSTLLVARLRRRARRPLLVP